VALGACSDVAKTDDPPSALRDNRHAVSPTPGLDAPTETEQTSLERVLATRDDDHVRTQATVDSTHRQLSWYCDYLRGALRSPLGQINESGLWECPKRSVAKSGSSRSIILAVLFRSGRLSRPRSPKIPSPLSILRPMDESRLPQLPLWRSRPRRPRDRRAQPRLVLQMPPLAGDVRAVGVVLAALTLRHLEITRVSL
jgi:hypothetical protein